MNRIKGILLINSAVLAGFICLLAGLIIKSLSIYLLGDFIVKLLNIFG